MTYRVRRVHHSPPGFATDGVLRPTVLYVNPRARDPLAKLSVYDADDGKHKRRDLGFGARCRSFLSVLRRTVLRKWVIFYALTILVTYLFLRHSLPTGSSTSTKVSSPKTRARSLIDGDTRAPLPQVVMSVKAHNHTVSNGLLQLDMNSSMHPIYQLIRDAREEWDSKNAKQSKTLLEAVQKYRRRYGRQPPQGFDKWWAYVCENNVPLPDEYDQINHDIAPFFAFSAGELRTRMEEIAETQDTYQMRISWGSLRMKMRYDEEIIGAQERVQGQADLLKPIAKWLPDMSVVYTLHDTPSQFIGWDYRQELLERAEEHDYVHPDDPIDSGSRGWQHACPSSSRLRSGNAHIDVPGTSFIANHKASMNPCDHPLHLAQHSALLREPQVDHLSPLFTLSKTPLHADVLAVPTEQWVDDMLNVPWEEKNKRRLLWRGSNTGAYYRAEEDWSQGHRLRLVELGARDRGKDRSLLPPPKSLDGKPLKEHLVSAPADVLNTHYLDLAFTGEPIQCNEEDGTCDKLREGYKWVPLMTHESALWYKYVLDVDGNGWSARFQRLLMSGSLVFKSTIMPEWWTDRIQPWVHYIPTQLDYSDLFDTLSFFRGDVLGRGGEDELAKDIAEAGRDWAMTHWRREDMTAYLFRLYLEWGRVTSDKRQRMDFVYEESMERRRE